MSEANTGKQQAPVKKMGGPEKAAALLLAMGNEKATRLLKHLSEEEIRVIARTASDLGMVPRPVLEEIVMEFSARVVNDGGLMGTPTQAQELLEGVMSSDQVSQIMSDVRSRMNEAVWPRLSEMQVPQLAQYFGKEHPQVIAFVLSKTSPALSAGVLGQLPNSLRNEVMRRMLANKLVLEPALRVMEQVLRDELLVKVARGSGQNIHSRIADIINKLDRNEMEEVLEDLNSHRPKEAKIVRGLLFTFEDVVKLKESARVTLLADIPPERLILALHACDPILREVVLVALASRTRRMVEQELTSGATPQQKEVTKARRAIADYALELAERGIIELKASENETEADEEQE